MDISYSGGMDSTALAIWAKQQGYEITLHFADTGAELPETLWFIPRVAKELDAKLIVYSGATFFQILIKRGYLPSWRVRWCTKELKIKVLPHDAAIGICANESHRMQGSFRPLVDAGIDEDEAVNICKKKNLINPIYGWRTHSSCFCCPFQRKSDWLGMAKKHPNLYELSEEWENYSASTNGFMFHENYSLKQLREAKQAEIDLFDEEIDSACAICVI